ncbi:hypothetical protein N2600_27905 (plasmid) [Rhizobium sp. WSM1274]|uniref:hypothetical protein n=1 Tax=Rhizobium sp. WSM1274 TaxID=3138254 RepID=UPI0021A67891|nr:hypothetical protein [Rhizobium leguminosarum]UWU31010.1 hypothetical protein N2600_27905 [Rhizobium leguminosarum bv. viciae]
MDSVIARVVPLFAVHRAGTSAAPRQLAVNPRTNLPVSFTMQLSSRETIWVAGNATEHIVEYASGMAKNMAVADRNGDELTHVGSVGKSRQITAVGRVE